MRKLLIGIHKTYFDTFLTQFRIYDIFLTADEQGKKYFLSAVLIVLDASSVRSG